MYEHLGLTLSDVYYNDELSVTGTWLSELFSDLVGALDPRLSSDGYERFSAFFLFLYGNPLWPVERRELA